ncbi:MAG: hypothetical protein JWO38_6383 [Gemmataceae bacterium]|nr:hypothetical protein [Gemmataceae bacterium]
MAKQVSFSDTAFNFGANRPARPRKPKAAKAPKSGGKGGGS